MQASQLHLLLCADTCPVYQLNPTPLQVKAVYLLVRRKKGMTAQQRVQKFLCGPLFTELHQQAASGGPNVFNKIRVLEGDIELPELGLSAADKEEVLSQVDVVIHSAAVLTLDAHIQDALR
jgi:fatty acyl-CoA reductase